ncbi:MAG: cation diffusion facilitator family transporter [Gammaproteobacteria bacterium]
MHDHAGHHSVGLRGSALFGALLATLVFAAIEAVGGWLSGSLALLGDAGHMLSDATALGLATFAAWVSRQPVSVRHSYGLGRAEVVAAIINGLFMVVIVISIAYHAVERFSQPEPVMAGTVILIAALGLLVNLLVANILHRGEKTLNTRAAMLHVLGDLLGSVAALVAGIVIYLTGWMLIDPILSLLICALILYSSLRLLREAIHIIMEGVPTYLDLPSVGRSMASVRGVRSIHDLHIWTLSSGVVALSAHVVIDDLAEWNQMLTAMRQLLHDEFDVEHVTLQPELIDDLPGQRLYKLEN